MSALFYILKTSFKNWFLELLHRPGKLILYVVCFGGMIALMISQLFLPSPEPAKLTDIIYLKGFFFGLIGFFAIIFVKRGLSNGDVIFEMRDVNLLFVSPISPKSILIYGIIQMIKTAFWAGFFMLFMGRNMTQIFGKGFSSILILFFSFMMITVTLSVLSLIIYTLTNGQTNRKRLVKIVTGLIFLPVVGVFCLQLIKSGNMAIAMESTLNSSALSWTPFAGWSAESAVAFIEGSMSNGLLFLAVTIIATIIMISYILLGNVDYYEDVLVATETAFEKKRAILEDQTNPEAILDSKVKVVKTGISGAGASTFFYKHLRESTRASALGLLSTSAITMIIGAGIFAFIMRDSGGAGMIVLQILMWMQIFMIGTGRGMKETMTHYIYMIPEPSFPKIIWSNLEPVARVLLESTLIFLLVGILCGESPFIIVGCIAVFTLFSLMLIGVNYLSMRWCGTELGTGILIMIYMLMVMVLMAPGLVAALVVAAGIGGTTGTTVGMGILSIWELLVAFGCFALSKGVLHNCDMQTTGK